MNETLVIGGNGKTGRRVAQRLKDLGLQVRLGSRSGEPPFDWTRQDTWERALRGTSAAYVSFFPDLAVPGTAETMGTFGEIAASAGVRRLVLLSGRGEVEAQRAERALQDAVPETTVVRASWFAQNFDEGYLLEPVLSGTVALPAGEVPEPFVDVDDIADVAVAALTEDGHAGEVYEVSGPRALSFADAVAEIGAAAGRELTYVQVSLDEYAAEASRQGTPPEAVEVIAYVFGEVLDGRNAQPVDGVRRALGRPPVDFAEYARKTARTGVWSVSR